MRMLAVAALALAPAAAQVSISAKPGAVTYVEGRVLLDGAAVAVAPARAEQMSDHSELRSGRGRAEVMLNPCAVLHTGENTGIRLVAHGLEESRVELLSGSVVVQTDGGQRYAGIRLVLAGRVVRLGKNGIYRLDANPPRLRVYYGKADVEKAGKVRAGQERTWGSGAAIRFDRDQTDALDRWHERRVWTLEELSGLAREQARQRAQTPPPTIQAAPSAEYAGPRRLPAWPAGGLGVWDRHRVCAP
jgi:hypothetical protein